MSLPSIILVRHLSIFGWLLKSRLRDEDDKDVVDLMLPYPYSSYVNSQRKKPAAAIAQIRQIVMQVAQQGLLPSAAHRTLESNLLELNRVFGMCERIRGSPIPPIYTAHTSRLLMFYLFLLPCALLEQVKLTSVIVTATALVGENPKTMFVFFYSVEDCFFKRIKFLHFWPKQSYLIC